MPRSIQRREDRVRLVAHPLGRCVNRLKAGNELIDCLQARTPEHFVQPEGSQTFRCASCWLTGEFEENTDHRYQPMNE